MHSQPCAEGIIVDDGSAFAVSRKHNWRSVGRSTNRLHPPTATPIAGRDSLPVMMGVAQSSV